MAAIISWSASGSGLNGYLTGVALSRHVMATPTTVVGLT